MAAEQPSVASHYIKVSHTNSDGVVVEGEVRAFVHAGGIVLWDLSALYNDLLNMLPKSHGVGDWLHSRRAQVSAMFSSLGMNLHEQVVPSRKSLRARNASSECAGPEHLPPAGLPVHDVFTATSAGLLVLLLYCSTQTRANMTRARCKAVAVAVLTKLLTPAVIESSELLHLGAHHVLMCPPSSGSAQHCHHFNGMMDGLVWCRSGFPQERFLEYLLFLHGLSMHCPAATGQIRDLIPRSALCMDSQAAHASFTDDPREATHFQRETQKRRRTDEALRESVVTQTRAEGRASSSAAYLRASGFAHPSRALQWEVHRLHEQLAEAWKVFQGCQAVHVAADGSRVGQPAREVEVTFAWHAEKQVGVWCPPMVP